jgi:hypothetical protein
MRNFNNIPRPTFGLALLAAGAIAFAPKGPPGPTPSSNLNTPTKPAKETPACTVIAIPQPSPPHTMGFRTENNIDKPGSVQVDHEIFDFGDGTHADSVQSPTHTYPHAGRYDVAASLVLEVVKRAQPPIKNSLLSCIGVTVDVK